MKNLLKILGTLGMSATLVAGSASVVSCGIIKELISHVLASFGFSLDQIFADIIGILSPLNFMNKLNELRENFLTPDGLKNIFNNLMQGIGVNFDFTQVNYRPIVDIDWPSLSDQDTWPDFDDLQHPIQWLQSKVHKIGLHISAKPDSTKYEGADWFYGLDFNKSQDVLLNY